MKWFFSVEMFVVEVLYDGLDNGRAVVQLCRKAFGYNFDFDDEFAAVVGVDAGVVVYRKRS